MGFIKIDQGKCTRGGVCVAECPIKVISMDSKCNCPTPTFDFEKYCIRCGHCVAVCPTGAFSLNWLEPEECIGVKTEMDISSKQARQLLLKRRSTRTFRKKIVPRSIIRDLLEVACSAPSAKNRQMWHWVVIEDPKEVQRLAKIVTDYMRKITREKPGEAEEKGFNRVIASWVDGNDSICRGAPHVLLVHGERDWHFGCEDTALSLCFLDLYANSLGLGTCWGGYFYKAVNEYKPLFDALGLPEDHLAFGALMLGYPKFKYNRIPRRNEARVNWR